MIFVAELFEYFISMNDEIWIDEMIDFIMFVEVIFETCSCALWYTPDNSRRTVKPSNLHTKLVQSFTKNASYEVITNQILQLCSCSVNLIVEHNYYTTWYNVVEPFRLLSSKTIFKNA